MHQNRLMGLDHSSNQAAEFQTQIEQLQAQKEIAEFKKQLSTKQITQEKIIRDELWKQKEDEVVFDLKDFTRQPAPPATPPPPPTSPWSEWMELLFG